jgi:hypothetical protein
MKIWRYRLYILFAFHRGLFSLLYMPVRCDVVGSKAINIYTYYYVYIHCPEECVLVGEIETDNTLGLIVITHLFILFYHQQFQSLSHLFPLLSFLSIFHSCSPHFFPLLSLYLLTLLPLLAPPSLPSFI